MGSTLTASEAISTERFIGMTLFFALSTPVGVLMAIDATVKACLQACVAGTFLYISIIEVGMKELLVCRVWERPSLAFVVGYFYV